MDQAELRALENRCIQDEAPACTAACPVHVYARAVIGAVAGGRPGDGAAVLRKQLPFPVTVALTCDEPCRSACLRAEHGDALMVRDLELVCLREAAPASRPPRPPARKGTAAVVGGGLTGLTAALELAVKGRAVTLFEREGRLGGAVWAALERSAGGQSAAIVVAGTETTPAAAVGAELAAAAALVTVRLAAPIRGAEEVAALRRDFDAVVLAHGDEPDRALPFGAPDPVTGATSADGVFVADGAMGQGRRWSPVAAIAVGRRLAVSADRHLQGVSLSAGRDREGPYQSRLFVDRSAVIDRVAVVPEAPAAGYSGDEARREADRCLQCACLECVKACVFLERYGSYPKQYVRQINNSLILTPGMGYRASKTMIDSCSLCGLCAVVCPNSVDMGAVCHEARRELVAKGYMPPAVHDLALHDLYQANGPEFALARHQPGRTDSAYAFFPGCQLPASSPAGVRAAYEQLAGRLQGGVGLLLGCCGAPAEWAGREDAVTGAVEHLRTGWERLGRPRLILACSSCDRLLRERAPDVPVVSLWEVLDEIGGPALPARGVRPARELPQSSCRDTDTSRPAAGAAQPLGGTTAGRVLALHDPCATRDRPAVRAAVRNLLHERGVEVVELSHTGKLTQCCGYGGLQVIVDRGLAGAVVARRTAQDPHDYVVYCAMCRDLFARAGKPTWHAIDLLFGGPAEDPARPGPRLTERHRARIRFRRDAVRELWQEGPAPSEEAPMRLEIPAELREKLEEELITEDDLAAVIEQAERSGRRLVDAVSGHFVAHARPRVVTYWVEYSPGAGGGYVVHRAYSHRLEILEGSTTSQGGTP
jgi:Fe-S oxidoreductase